MALRSIRKILIANRGEIAIRVMRTCREMGIGTVAVYSEVDRTSPHVRAADEAYGIGPAPSRQSYLDMNAILRVARHSGADAIHPGYGFLSENAQFARRVRDAGLVFIGPPPESIAAMGDKTSARMLVRSAGVPTVPGTDGPVQDLETVVAFTREHGFPVLLKAAAGGGGKGMRVVHSEADLASALSGARSEAQSAFGDDRVYVEKYLEAPRHIEIQVFADQYGNAIHLGERECSIQRRHQKVIEETPSAIVDDAMRSAMGETAVAAARACGYQNAGTIEFLVDREKKFYFLEMNTRLQVEHPVTELRTGLDLVALQIRVARGEKLPLTQQEVRFSGHAIECRICAEDVANGFLPATGSIVHLKSPGGPGVREDRGVERGGAISMYYDSMISKLVVWAPSRLEAIERMKRALSEYELLGVPTTIPLCRFVLSHPLFASGNFTTHFLNEHFTAESLKSRDDLASAAAAAVCAVMENERILSGGDPATDGVHAPTSRWRKHRSDFMRPG